MSSWGFEQYRDAARMASEARAAWEQGAVVPHRITAALDLRGLYGPEVDEACGAEEPAVDQWETGDLYPTFEQLVALAKLTEFPLPYFFKPVDADFDGPIFICNRSSPSKSMVSVPDEPVAYFKHTALVLAGIRSIGSGIPGPGADSLF